MAAGLADGVCPQLSAMAGLYHLPFRIDRERQERVCFAKRPLDRCRRRAAREDESQVAGAFGQRDEALIDLGGDLDALDAVNRSGRVGSRTAAEYSAPRD